MRLLRQKIIGKQGDKMSDLYQIKSEHLQVEISSLGAQVMSIKDKEGLEYLWQGDPQFWAERFLVLFPYVARMSEGGYTYKGKTYHMDLHGFAKDTIFQVIKQEENKIVFFMEDSPVTRTQFPFEFGFEITYEVVEAKLWITYQVQNRGMEKMYFGIGGHPGFRVPLHDDEKFTDYMIQFPLDKSMTQIELNEEHFRTGKTFPYDFPANGQLHLTHELFDDDAINLTDLSHKLSLSLKNGKEIIRMEFPDVDYLGIWHTQRKKPNFVCIEPLASLPSRCDRIEDFSTHDNLIGLEQQETYLNRWNIEVVK